LPTWRPGANVRDVIRVFVGIDPRALCGTDAAVDRGASASRYVVRLREGLARELPHVTHEVTVGARFVRVEGLEGGDAARLRAHVEAVADAVRHCGDWVVYE
jgi:hypothetical protein